MIPFLVIVGLIVGSMWLYFRFFAKTPCGCQDK
jgi:hypothetical protein